MAFVLTQFGQQLGHLLTNRDLITGKLFQVAHSSAVLKVIISNIDAQERSKTRSNSAWFPASAFTLFPLQTQLSS